MMEGPVYIICGGTGGHLAPGIATAQQLEARGVEVCLVVSHKEIDSHLMRRYPEIGFLRARAAPFSFHPIAALRFIVENARGFLDAIRILRRARPKVILAFGGYLTASWCFAGRLSGIPLLLHEANRVPGRSIRMLSRLADKVFAPEGVRIRGVAARHLMRMEMPLRKEVVHIPKDQIREQMGIPRSAKVLVVVGGSQGAQALNEWVGNHYAYLAAEGIWVLHVSGPGKGGLTEVEALTSDSGDAVEVRRFEFHNALYELFSCADLVVSRAGAGSIAELVMCLAPAILVPYPSAADGHQEANARYMERRGAALLVRQTDMDNLLREVLDTVYNDWLLGRMRDNLRALSKNRAAIELVEILQRGYVGTI
jgi:UDP-N-acetylglucosamine--N-acetylmuramyl-(pentapeptide) pyrophosphoryl-undecaprenol N-acetylglucosamine transferase